jgi:hypothetical protein
MVSLANNSDCLPQSLFVSGLQLASGEKWRSGGFGDIYLAKYDDRNVVVKRPHPSEGLEKQSARRVGLAILEQ